MYDQSKRDMGVVWAERLAFARTTGLRHVTELPQLAGLLDTVALVVVGSTATGWLRAGSDVDIAVVADEGTYRRIVAPDRSHAGDLGESLVDGVPLHVFADRYSSITAQVATLDDFTIFLYAPAIVLWDPGGYYARWARAQFGESSGLRARRLAAAQTAARRARADLRPAIEIGDPFLIAQLGLEGIRHCLRLAGLCDGLHFDPRKRLYTTALAGPTGARLVGDFRTLFALAGELANPSPGAREAGLRFAASLDQLIASLCEG